MYVNARSGLRLRAGPGTEFDSVALLPMGTRVFPMKASGGWTMVDLEGDNVADGFVSGAFLTDDAPPGVVEVFLGADASCIPSLIRNGSTVDGLKSARLTAAASLPGYPHNGCAAHLSALLQQSGIGVKMTWGAGALARILQDRRGWNKISVGSQAPGDIGVTFDNDPTPPGADHIYLVVGTNGADEMMIADNQRTADKPHKRYASGAGGKTPTEYFLRPPSAGREL